eukprot:TRINITY_DN10431_c0_g1_i1.p1 TRINITY_DN10431_c0_g1~~TRINITY_DN10431_c0_g1_i1.p1  ORF type:complete len:757 (-),score=148.73 TRINITY_DN10431_c0_g1_i1:109-2379(-)
MRVTISIADDPSPERSVIPRTATQPTLTLPQERKLLGGSSKTAELLPEGSSRRELIKILTQKGAGSFLRGWRNELDPDALLNVPFQVFANATKRLGLGSSSGITAKRYTVQANMAKSGALHLSEVAPDMAVLVDRFRSWVNEVFGGPEGLWHALERDCLHHGQSEDRIPIENLKGFLDKHEFQASADEMQELEGCCDADGGGTITLDELLFLEYDPRVRETQLFKLRMKHKNQRQHMLTTMYTESWSRVSSYRTSMRPWQAVDFERLPKIAAQKRRERVQNQLQQAKAAKTEFRRSLAKIFGTVVRAWRRELDPQGRFSVEHVVIRRFCARRNLSIDLAAMLGVKDLDENQRITMEELCPQAATALASFSKWAHDSFGSCSSVWELPETLRARSLADADECWTTGASNKKLLYGSFAKVLQQLGFPDVETARLEILLKNLDLFGCGFISHSDLVWLDGWDPPEWLYSNKSVEALEDLKHAFGRTPFQNWRQHFDTSNTNSVSFASFKSACKQMGWNGDVGGAWRAYDEKMSGKLSLKEFDHDSFVLLDSLREWVQRHYGSVKLAFQALSKDANGGNGELSFMEFKRALQRLHWNGDLRAVFSIIDSRPRDATAGPKKNIASKDLEFLDAWLPQVNDEDEQSSSDRDFSDDESPDLPSINQSRHKRQRRMTVRKSATRIRNSVQTVTKTQIHAGEANAQDSRDEWTAPSGSLQWVTDLPHALGEASLARWCAKSGHSVKQRGATSNEFYRSQSLPRL